MIMANLSVYISSPSRRRLLLSGRLLVVKNPLEILNVEISADRTAILITTSYEVADLSTSSIVIDFPAGTLKG